VNALLILYPIQPYAGTLMMGPKEPQEIKVKYAEVYQQLMHKRYPGFKTIWIMFSMPGFPELPDMSILWEDILIGVNDIVSACGISFEENHKEKKYPNPKTIIDACPKNVERLVIGGFHFWDCVEKC
jgi:hypothetical protein